VLISDIIKLEINISMTEIQPIQTQQLNPSALSQEDIARLPKNYGIPSGGLQADTYESQQESGKAKSIIVTALVAAAALVGLKHLPFMKVEKEATGFIAKFIKKPIAAVGGAIEWPFVKLAGIFKSKNVEEAAEDIIDTPPPEIPKKGLKAIKAWCGDKWHSLSTWVKNKCHKAPAPETTV